MPIFSSLDRIRFLVRRLRERLWVKPLAICLLSILAVWGADFADGTGLAEVAPDVTQESIEGLLSIVASSMLVIATFAVGSMVSSYASADRAATPRSFSLVVADDVSQNALSTFLGAFIFSIVALTAVKNHGFGEAGRLAVFALTVLVFAIVILTFVRWMDRIARLGRVGSTIDRVEAAAAGALERRRDAPTMYGVEIDPGAARGRPVSAARVGYVQHVDVAGLQEWARRMDVRVQVAVLPGTFVVPGRELALVRAATHDKDVEAMDTQDFLPVVDAFLVGDDRDFQDDPRFGLVALAEIADRALSPGVNDPGTAIDIIGTMVRLLFLWIEPVDQDDDTPRHDRVEVPRLSVEDLFDDAFTAIARDGAGFFEVSVRLQKALAALAATGDPAMRLAAIRHGRMALRRSEKAMSLPEDVEAVRKAARFAAGA